MFRAIKALFATAPGGERARVAVIALLAEERDRKLLAGICKGHDWNVYFAETCGGATGAAKELNAPIILCDRDLPGSEWREAVETLAAPPHNACVILVSKVLDEYLREEVGSKNGYDVLAKPLREHEVVRSIKLAWAYWKQRGHRAASGKY